MSGPAVPQDNFHDKKSGTSATEGPAAEKCILLEVVPGEYPYRQYSKFPFLWPQQLTGLDLAAEFTLTQNPVRVNVAVEQFYSETLSGASALAEARYNAKLRATESAPARKEFETRMGLLLGNPPYGTGATAYLDFVSHRAAIENQEKNQTPALYIADSLEQTRFDYVKAAGKVPFTVVRRSYRFKAEVAAMGSDLAFVEPLQWNGLPADGELPKDHIASFFVPDEVIEFRGDPATTKPEAYQTKDNARYFLAAAAANALALVPGLSNASLSEWVRLTANRENQAFAATGVPTLNAYYLVRTMARLRDACRDKNLATCEAAIRVDETKREALLDFRAEALEKFNAGLLTLKNATTKCTAKQSAMQSLREAMLLDPANRKYRAALADFYDAEKFYDAGDYLRFGKETAQLVEQTELWEGMAIQEQTWKRRALRRTKTPLADGLAKALKSPNPAARTGAIIASAALSDRAAIELLKDVVRQKDWRALGSGLNSIIISETRQEDMPTAKIQHYVPLLKAGIAGVRADTDAQSYSTLISYYRSLDTLIKSDVIDLEKKRHLIDYLTEESLRGRPKEMEMAAMALARLGYYDRGFADKYVARSWIHVARTSQDATIIGIMVKQLGEENESRRRFLAALINERKAKVPDLKDLHDWIITAGWAKR